MKKELLYEGKAKRIYRTDHDQEVVVEYKDSLTAFNALKKGSFAGKGHLNLEITDLIFNYLQKNGIPTHLIRKISETELLVKKVEIIPLEVVVRNILAGSTAKKFNIQEGRILEAPLVEFYFKDDALGDPFLSDDQALMLRLCTQDEILKLKELALKVNKALQNLMAKAKITLVDFKIEIGRSTAGLILADEISPDCCRLWDQTTGEKLDKDRFRRDLGKVEESYQEVHKRLVEVLR